MKKLKLYNKRGFTLVECIVAIALFAVLTSLVLMIIAGTYQTQKVSKKAEEDLNQLVQNVVEDQSSLKYDKDSTKTLKMGIEGSASANFSITYNAVNGFKNYVKCPSCGEKYNNLDFMSCVYDDGGPYETDIAIHPENKNNKPSFWFNPTSMQYLCPGCGYRFYDNKLECLDCGQTGTAQNAGDFHFDSATGDYYCANCGSGNVSNTEAMGSLTDEDDVKFNVGTIRANAVRYGLLSEDDLKERKKEDIDKLMVIEGDSLDSKTFKATLEYIPNERLNIPGRYRLRFSGFNIGTGPAKVTVQLPPHYICKVISKSANFEVEDPLSWSVYRPSNYAEKTETTRLIIDNLNTSNVGSGFYLEFTLTNFMNNSSFDYDFLDETSTAPSLASVWFDWSSNVKTYTTA